MGIAKLGSHSNQLIKYKKPPKRNYIRMDYGYNRPYGNNYYEAEREVIREGPYGGYQAEYRLDEYGNRVSHHRSGVGNVVTEIVKEVIPGGHNHNHHHGHQHYGRPAEIIERREERIVDSVYDPYVQRVCLFSFLIN